MRVLILYDEPGDEARADELDALVQVDAVQRALEGTGASVSAQAFGPDAARTGRLVRAARPTVVFNLVESVQGDGRRIDEAPELLESLGVAFTGAGARAMRRSSSKLSAKEVLSGAGIATPAWRTLEELRAGRPLGGSGRWIVKSVWEHGSLGLESHSVVAAEDPTRLAEQVAERRPTVGGEAFAEEYVHGREFNVALLSGPTGPECLPLPEIRFEGLTEDQPRVVGYRAKWAPGSPEWDATPRSFGTDPADATLHARLRQRAIATWHAFELDGWARVDFRVGADGQPQVIDVNANPCLSPDAGFAAALEQAGIPYAHALLRIVAAARAPSRAVREESRVPHPTDCR